MTRKRNSLAGYPTIRARNKAIMKMRMVDCFTLESIGEKVSLTRQQIHVICEGKKPKKLSNRISLKKDTLWGSKCPECDGDKKRGQEICDFCEQIDLEEMEEENE